MTKSTHLPVCLGGLAAATALGVAACAAGPGARDDPPLGSVANPVRAHTYLGELEYLSRLRCADGTKPHAKRLLRRRPGPYGNSVIGYRVRCIYMNHETVVHIDELHPRFVEERPVPGFATAGPADPRRLFWLDR